MFYNIFPILGAVFLRRLNFDIEYESSEFRFPCFFPILLFLDGLDTSVPEFQGHLWTVLVFLCSRALSSVHLAGSCRSWVLAMPLVASVWCIVVI
jgi:NhaP-type Na+/H+ or K+/H+ antiporter